MAGNLADIRRWGRSLEEIEKNKGLELGLKRLDESLKETLALVETRRGRASVLKNEMFLVVSFYFVFQGGVLTALVSKANAAKCDRPWSLAAMSAIAFVAVVVSVHDKFRDYHEIKRKRALAELRATRFKSIIKDIMIRGGSFKFEDIVVGPSSPAESSSPAEPSSPVAPPAQAEPSLLAEPPSGAEPSALVARSSRAELPLLTEGPSRVEPPSGTEPPLRVEPASGTKPPSGAEPSSLTDGNSAVILFLQARRYFDLMVFLFIVFAIVFLNCLYVC